MNGVVVGDFFDEEAGEGKGSKRDQGERAGERGAAEEDPCNRGCARDAEEKRRFFAPSVERGAKNESGRR